MPTWIELEQRFLELEPSLNFARLDQQTGTDGEYWHVAATFDMVAKSRFESLSTIAGRKLADTFSSDSLPDELRDAPNDKVRWYRSLARNYHFYKPGMSGYLSNDKGEKTGWIASGSINKPASVSAAHCLELSAMTSDENKPLAPLTINVSGANSRLNVASVDNSVNTVNSTNITVFRDIRKVIADQLDSHDRTSLQNRLDELEAAVNTPSYATKYKEFMQTAANHVTVLAPFLPALASFLT